MRQVDTLNTRFRGEPCVEFVFEVCRHVGDYRLSW
jgi:hypothetical protein